MERTVKEIPRNMTTDPVIEILTSFEIRFDAFNHDTILDSLQPDIPGESRLKCLKCGEVATVSIREEKAWTLVGATNLGRLCAGTNVVDVRFR